ncbi:thymidine kinase [Mesomycoplasma ovipneumoniae]|uniref:Thymidine kinase n=1 Tax=Mesomycoplasma ovipneumoniae TaxID=29562 RepID=A0AAJ2UDS9_9BACT|nr:thymidine kinase [Mesomycoplasma ovipneumoniae]MDW2829356.1 thymidine kinase [Mesomycoplasma ovipneumoniae]MDW2834546.1 thymidine kinase [Mesomycoplasma ovipneumoniae]MDW2835283.1 thymidine kinase [Mesomycoplasma ovipneumoniae]MDW2852327.1 thymidine kinase [Mesomycoplasma ovipneumoniae]MDW2860672.1 thymidine kinase [Mesomycoplasma ovipneumoniae]
MYKKFFEGIIEVITGPMFSGKSDELIKRIKILTYANIKILVIKPLIDNRFSDCEIVSRSGLRIPTFSAKTTQEIKELFAKEKYGAIAIDEIQFFSEDIIPFLDKIANKGIRVIVSGLDQDFRRKPFGVLPNLMAIAENVTKLQAVCTICKRAATTSARLVKSDKQNLIGDSAEYEARCRACHNL